jgi:hypothetical protein
VECRETKGYGYGELQSGFKIDPERKMRTPRRGGDGRMSQSGFARPLHIFLVGIWSGMPVAVIISVAADDDGVGEHPGRQGAMGYGTKNVRRVAR